MYMREQRYWKSPKPCLHKKFLKRKKAQSHWKLGARTNNRGVLANSSEMGHMYLLLLQRLQTQAVNHFLLSFPSFVHPWTPLLLSVSVLTQLISWREWRVWRIVARNWFSEQDERISSAASVDQTEHAHSKTTATLDLILHSLSLSLQCLQQVQI